MAEEQVAKVFSPFVQADSSTARNYGGTGLGLSIVKRIVDAMGGEINLSSTPGVGSTFRITLDFAVANETAAAAPQKIAVNTDKLPAATSILVAEDNETNRLIIETFLKRAGAATTMAENGEDAVEQFKRGRYDLILMDIHMPVMDGEEAFQEIRKLQGGGGFDHTPIIAVTADAMDHQVRHYLDFGFDGHLPKPVTEKALVQTILRNLPPAGAVCSTGDAVIAAHS
jgi:CheY-like chemotaxis protein